MRLIGMLDSPYVRRVAVALHLMELPFAHEALSVFRQFDAFATVNPVVKAPTLVTDDGTVLMDSTLILLFVERLVAPNRRLTPPDANSHLLSLRVSGLALAACEKTMQIAYEINLRPAEKRHRPWLDRVGAQLRDAYRLLDSAVAAEGWTGSARPTQGDVDAAVAWRFTREALAGHAEGDIPDPARHARLAALAERAETGPAFRAAPTQ